LTVNAGLKEFLLQNALSSLRWIYNVWYSQIRHLLNIQIKEFIIYTISHTVCFACWQRW
jgi:hypothetical protein